MLSYQVSEEVDIIEVESRIVVTRGRGVVTGEGDGGGWRRVKGKRGNIGQWVQNGFQLDRRNKFWCSTA